MSVAAALDAKISVTGKNGARSIDFAAFPVGYMTSSIALDELVTGATFPCWPAGHGYAFVEFARRHGDFAIVSAAALIEEDNNGKVTRASLTLGGMGPAPVRAGEVERALIGEVIEEKRLREICETLRKLDAIDDIHAPASYRQQSGDGAVAPRACQSARAHRRGEKAVSETRNIAVTVNGKRHEADRAGAGDACGFLAPSARPHRHPSRLRARRVRRLHHSASTAIRRDRA